MYGKAEDIRAQTDAYFHDLANILQATIGGVELLRIKNRKNPLSTSDLESELSYIVDTGLRGRQLIAKARAYLRNQAIAAKERSEYTPTQFREYFTGHIASKARSFGLQYTLKRFEVEERKISINESGLFNGVINIFQNSSQAGANTITQDIWIDPEFVRISFEDNGRGMTPEVKDRCLQPGYTTKPGIGTGLGLALLNEYAKEEGGHLAVESELEKGTRITLALSRKVCYPPLLA